MESGISNTTQLEGLYRGYSIDQRTLNELIAQMPPGGWKESDEAARELWENKIIECRQTMMAKQEISKANSMRNYASAHGKPHLSMGHLWRADIATRLSQHMRIDPIYSEPMASGPFDADNYLTWLKHYAQIKLEQGTVFKNDRAKEGDILEHDRSHAYAEAAVREQDRPIEESERNVSSSDKKRAALPTKESVLESSDKRRDIKSFSKEKDHQW